VTSSVAATPSSLGVNIAVLIDSKFGFEVVKTWVKSKGVALRLWLDIDGGYHRTGMNYEEDSDIDVLLAEISKEVKQEYKDLILLDGLYYHGGNSYGSKTIEEIEKYSAQERDAVKGMQAKCEKHSMTFRTMAVGSTPTCSRPPAVLEPINEIHPGNYIFYDSWQALIGSCDWTSNASWVLAQIVSTYTTPDRAAFDAGALALSKDLGASHVRDLKYTASSPSSQSSVQDTASGPMASHPIVSLAAPIEFGLIESHQDVLYISRITQEMGIIEVRKSQVSSGAKAHQLLKPSDRIRISPNHSCLSAACFPSLFIVHGENVVDEWVTAPRIW
jgi:D-serine deaminase-like pyridoxal phosphate-dependent protein